MSDQPELAQRSDASCPPSDSSTERITFYTDDLSLETSLKSSPDISRRLSNYYTYPVGDRSSFCRSNQHTIVSQLDDHSVLYLPSTEEEVQRNICARSKASGLKQTRNSSEFDKRASRRCSMQSNRSRMNNRNRQTSLGRRQLGQQTFCSFFGVLVAN